ncbi:MAG: hypothetical protein EBV64_05475 [Oxalobacteraceae bacterium]|jgi:hypothetical protein|nr:hypothetical protein [Oxalobacteraceae bacterium]
MRFRPKLLPDHEHLADIGFLALVPWTVETNMNLRGLIKAITSRTHSPTVVQTAKGYQKYGQPFQAVQKFISNFANHFRSAREALPADVKNIKTLQPKETKPYHHHLKENNIHSAPTGTPSKTDSASTPKSNPPETRLVMTREATKELTLISENNDPLKQQADANKNRNWSDLSENQKKAVNEHLFGRKEHLIRQFADVDHPFFRDFRQYILKEDPDSPATADTVKRFSFAVSEREKLLANKYKFFQEHHDKKFNNAGIYNSSSQGAKEMDPSEYLMMVAETDTKDVRRMNYFDEPYRKLHTQNFKHGSVSSTTASSYNKFIKDQPTVGRPGPLGGMWVQPATTIDDILKFNEKHPDLSLSDCLEISLGMPPGSYKNDLVISMKSSIDTNTISVPLADLLGANKEYREGGYTLGTANPEGHAPSTPKKDVAFGIWGLPADHPLHPKNAKPGNQNEFDAFLSSKENVEKLMRQNRIPLRELQASATPLDTEVANLASLAQENSPIFSRNL